MPLHHRLRIPPATAALILLLAGLFGYYARQPLYHTDLWGHLANGRWIAEHRRLPPTEPFMPLSADLPIVDTAWLSQLAGFGVQTVCGLPGLQFAYALAITASCGFVAWSACLRTGRAWGAFAAVFSFVALEFFQFRVIRPQVAGLVLFVALDAVLATRSRSRWRVWVVPILFAVWANVHGSFVMGLGLLAGHALGRMIDVGLRGRRLVRSETAGPDSIQLPSRGRTRLGSFARSVGCDRQATRLWGLFVLAAVGALLNPYGPRLYAEVLSFASHPNLHDLLEWTPLDFRTRQGQSFALATILLAILAVISLQRAHRIAATSWLPLIVLGVATVWSARMLVWWSPLAASAGATLLGGIIRRPRPGNAGMADSRRSREVPRLLSERSVQWSLVAAGGVMAALGSTPLASQIVTGPVGDPRQFVSRQTPVEAVEWLRTHDSQGLHFNSYEWGDYFVWAGPPQAGPFVTSQVHVIPPRVWRDYREISRGEPAGLERLDDYRVRTVLLNRATHKRLADLLAADARWSRVYLDDQAVIFVRRRVAGVAAERSPQRCVSEHSFQVEHVGIQASACPPAA